ncbi:MAG: GNAT family N-acetyltransferase [Burkholderiales bacterium]|nr:GNAT family N-acetyltransferase [Burkholderiales bacterium]
MRTPQAVAMEIRRHPQAPGALALLAACALPVADLDVAHFADFFFSGDPAAPTGVVGLEFAGDVALLRSLAVAAAARGQGLGARLVAAAEAHARARRATAIYLLTDGAADWFAARGYRAIARGAAPPSIRATRQFAALCPASAVLMVKPLAG